MEDEEILNTSSFDDLQRFVVFCNLDFQVQQSRSLKKVKIQATKVILFFIRKLKEHL